MPGIYQIERALLEKQVRRYSSYIKGRVLDAGSGSMNRYGKLFDADEYVRLDVAPGSNVDVVGSIEEMPFTDAEFDAVVSTQVLEHVPHPHLAAKEIFRVLRPGGRALITVPQWNELHEEPHDYWRYTSFGLANLFTEAGFTVLASEQRGGFFAARAQMGMRYLIDRFSLYQHWWGRAFHYAFRVWGAVALALDRADRSAANRKHAIGWIFVFEKPL
ncbi:MAG TPA: class I SAM-dependent methyltransferase [Candidatus Paceibacterota bacterium]|nr:class I SAM-dependent methyltransferase [Candidatus Paceibacterota bacterium]